jgi:hypothetical protein
MEPYEAQPGAAQPVSAAPAKVSTAAKILGGVVCGIGLLCVLGNLALLALRMSDPTIPWSEVPWRFKFWEVELRAVAALVGVILLFGGVQFIRGRWRSGLISVIGAVLLGISNPIANSALRHYFAGDVYVIEAPSDTYIIEAPTDQTP